MRFSMLRLQVLVLGWFAPLLARSQDAAPVAEPALVAATNPPPVPHDFIEYVLDRCFARFGIHGSGNSWQHWAIAGFITVVFYGLRKVVANVGFGFFKRLTARTETTLDDELIVAWRRPVAAFIAVFGLIVALKVLKISPEAEGAFRYFKTIALSVVALWFFIITVACVLDHLHAVAKAKGTAVAAFMPWIKKSVIAVFLIFGVLIAAQSLGADVKAFLAGLGIGGLAFALAAQDTLANVFGSVVVAVDQPFRVGEFVQIGAHQGTVEDIGLRSTKLRTPARTLIAIPNKTVASEAINNFSRMPQRRVDQTIGLTYSARASELEALLGELRALLREDAGVHQEFTAVHFVNYGASSLDIQIIYFTADPDVKKSFETRERINLAIMRLVEAHRLNFAFPTQTIELAGKVAERLAAGRESGARL
jgi:MscS family membrane protein